MTDRELSITAGQWSRFVGSIMPTLAELLTVGLLNGIADEVDLVGGKRKDDVRARLDATQFTVEVKTAWWHTPSMIGHSPVRATQTPNLVALVGKFDTSDLSPTLRSLDQDALVINADRMFYLVPHRVIERYSKLDGKSAARALISPDALERYKVDLEIGITRDELVLLLADSRSEVRPGTANVAHKEGSLT